MLLRQFEPGHAHHRAAVDSITRWVLTGEPVHVTPQNIAELWATATRTPAQDGLGLTVALAASAVDHIERVFTLLPDHPAIYDHWKRLVATHGVIGNQVYDARLVAAMMAHGVGRDPHLQRWGFRPVRDRGNTPVGGVVTEAGDHGSFPVLRTGGVASWRRSYLGPAMGCCGARSVDVG